MIKIISDKKIYAKIENEIEKLILPLIIESKDLIETKIVRNIFSRKDGKKIDRVECFAKIRVEKVNLDKMRIIGKIEDVSNERVSKGYHGENIEEGKEFVIEKEKLNEKTILLIEKIKKIRLEENFNFNKLIMENHEKFLISFDSIKEYLEYGMIKILFICIKEFFNFFDIIYKALEKNSEIVIIKNSEFCKKLKIAALLRFNF
ncbi:MAG: hypothetical protein QXQ19_02350 [Candidatus Aenigmatarchaeota archaeon]